MLTEIFKRPSSIGGQELKKEQQRQNDFFKQFEGKRVRIKYSREQDWSKTTGEKTGWLVKNNTGYCLITRRNSRKGWHLTLGLYDGWHATITVTEINLL